MKILKANVRHSSFIITFRQLRPSRRLSHPIKMEIITRTLRVVLLLVVASILVAKIECAPAQEETAEYLNRNELLRLFQEDARWASSSQSHSKSSEEFRGQYQPMPYSPVRSNSLSNVAGGPPGGNDVKNNILVPQPY